MSSEQIEKSRNTVQNILQGQDSRMLVIVGPCSIHSKEEALEYAQLLKEEQTKYEETLFFVMRTYFQKPRTTVGWEGLSVDPHLDGSYDYKLGIQLCQEICEEITNLGIPIADEALNMELTDKWRGYLSYAALGARNSEDQNMRKYCSSMKCPVGVKHPRSANLEDGVNGVLSVEHPHKLFYKDALHTTSGNTYAHLILRGSSHHNNGNNITPQNIEQVDELFMKNTITTPAIICDVSHDNSRYNGEKRANYQYDNIENITKLISHHDISQRLIKGVMIESHINHGKQSMNSYEKLDRGVSITDECLGFEDTKKLFIQLHEHMRNR